MAIRDRLVMVRRCVRKLKQMAWAFRWKGLNRLGAERECYICGHRFRRFYPYRQGWSSVPPFIRQMAVVGSDVENFGCPFCHSNDRERHLFLYFDRLKLWEALRDAAVLHFAPERNLSQRIKSANPRKYVKADLYPADLYGKNPEIERVDLTDISFGENTFDFLICNHVLEHVPDDRRAFAEISRVLRPGGRAILQTPFSTILTRTLDDPGISTDLLRLQLYGQEDHVRLYGRDFLDRIQAAGLRLNLCRHGDVATLEEASRHGMNRDEDLILAEKPARSGSA